LGDGSRDSLFGFETLPPLMMNNVVVFIY